MQRTTSSIIGPLLEDAWPNAYRIAWTILRNATDAEDAAQEACARALKASGALHEQRAFRSWFFRIVVNEARGRLRRRRYDPIVDEPRVPFESPDDRIDLARAIDVLDEPSRLVILLFYYVQFSTAEIADVVGASPLAVRLRLLTARRRLRRFLAHDTSMVAERTADEQQAVK